MFKSDFRIVAEYFVQMRTKKDYTPSTIEIKHVHETLQLMSAVTHDDRFLQDRITENGGEVRIMSEFLDRIISEGEQRGFHNGMQQGIQQGMQQGIQQGIQQGMQQGLINGMWNLVSGGIITTAVAAQQCGMTEAAFLKTKTMVQ